MNATQVRGVELNTVIAGPSAGHTNPDLNATLAATPAFATQTAAVPELRVLSQPPGRANIDRYPNYVYQSGPPAEDVYIYHAELGINQTYDDFQQRQGGIEWVYTGRAIEQGQNTQTEAPNPEFPGHSTCTASKAAGKIYGASKNGHLVVVKCLILRWSQF